jgi:hypothetical protein
MLRFENGRTIRHRIGSPQRFAKCRRERKVRTPQGKAPGNARAGQLDGSVAQKKYRPPSRRRSLERPELRRDDHSSRLVIAHELQRPTRWPRTGRSIDVVRRSERAGATLFGLAPCGVLPATDVTAGAVRSYRTFSPLPLDSALARLAQGNDHSSRPVIAH